MATRIHPRLAPAEPASPGLEPNAEMLLAPPPNLSKRLTAAVHRSLPGWTVQVLVKRWTEDHVRVLITAQRGSASAPPAPLPGSPQAEKLTNRLEVGLESTLEQQYPGVNFKAVGKYSRSDADQCDISVDAWPEGNKNDPPTCIDGDGEVIFPGDGFLNMATNKIEVSVPASSSLGADTLRRVFAHCHGKHMPLAPPDPTFQPYRKLGGAYTVPRLFHAGSEVNLEDGWTFGRVVTNQTPLVLQVGSLDDWWVWW